MISSCTTPSIDTCDDSSMDSEMYTMEFSGLYSSVPSSNDTDSEILIEPIPNVPSISSLNEIDSSSLIVPYGRMLVCISNWSENDADSEICVFVDD